jgi:hypothetical protein
MMFRSMHLAASLSALLLVAAGPAVAQETSGEVNLPALNLQAVGDQAQPAGDAALEGPLTPLRLAAALTEDGEPIASDIMWRVFEALPGAEGKLKLAAKSDGGSTEFLLPPGEYLVHAAFGRAGATKRIVLAEDVVDERMVLNAGGLMMNAKVASSGAEINPAKLKFSIYEAEADLNGERRLIVPNVTPGAVVRLNEGTYHIVSNYGAVNAIIRTDVRVEPGVVTEATVEQRAAELTLKLVSQAGGEGLADTSWSVFTESGELVFESAGAYAPLVLAEGAYSVVAKHRGRIFERAIDVQSGGNGDIEVIATF